MGKRISIEKRRQVLRKLEDSELSGAEFCRRQGLCYASVMRWRREAQHERSDSGRIPFVELEVTDEIHPGQENDSQLFAELSLPGGAVLRLYGTEQSGIHRP